MSAFAHPFAARASLLRTVAFAGLVGAALIAGPCTAARAANPVSPTPAATQSGASHQETIEQRITSLHKSLQITAAEEANWNAVAQAMRDSAANLDKLVEDRDANAAQSMTALDDLTTYQKFAQEHVNGLNNLIPAFTTLYNSMPDTQKKVADRVFGDARRRATQARS